MRATRLALLFALLCVGSAVATTPALAAADAAAAPSDCATQGFAPGSLLCGSCDDLGSFVGEDTPLVEDCQRCCASERAADRTYHSATLEVERSILKHYPELAQLVERVEADPTLLPALSIVEPDAAPSAGGYIAAWSKPTLVLRRGRTKMVETAFVKFKVDQMVSFLQAKLRPPKGAKAPPASGGAGDAGRDEL